MTKNLIFDFDGTLVDTCEGIVRTEMETFRRLGLPAPPREDIVGAIGLPLELSLEKGGGLDRQTAVKAAAIYRSIFNEVAAPHITMFPGVYETLESLRGRGL